MKKGCEGNEPRHVKGEEHRVESIVSHMSFVTRSALHLGPYTLHVVPLTSHRHLAKHYIDYADLIWVIRVNRLIQVLM